MLSWLVSLAVMFFHGDSFRGTSVVQHHSVGGTSIHAMDTTSTTTSTDPPKTDGGNGS